MKAKVIRKRVMDEVQRQADMLGIERPDVHFYREKEKDGNKAWGEVGEDCDCEICIVNADTLTEQEFMDLAYKTARIMRRFWQMQTCVEDFIDAFVTTESSEEGEETEYPLEDVDAAAFGMMYSCMYYGMPREIVRYGTGFFDCMMQRLVEITPEYSETGIIIGPYKEADF